jgi:putative phosphoesterase
MESRHHCRRALVVSSRIAAVLAVLSDTHGRDDPRLSGRTAEAVETAETIIHAGDLTTIDVLESLKSRGVVHAVAGNNDPPAVRDRLPDDRIVEWAGLRIVVAHGHQRTDTALSMFGRQASADLVVVGHSHAPEFRDGIVPMLNPGSHADPRWNRPSHAELEWDAHENRARGRLVEPAGTTFETFVVEPRDRSAGRDA